MFLIGSQLDESPILYYYGGILFDDEKYFIKSLELVYKSSILPF